MSLPSMNDPLHAETEGHSDVGVQRRQHHRNVPALPSRLRGGADYNEQDIAIFACSSACGCCTGFLFFFSLFLTAIGPNEYGLLLNKYAGTVASTPVRGGVHRRWPWQEYIIFPATQVNVVWADSYFGIAPDELKINAKTGHDKDVNHTAIGENEASGQPIDISCSMQYKYISNELDEVYKKLVSHTKAKERITLLAQSIVIMKSQDFSPQDFWGQREIIATEILLAMKDFLRQYNVKVIRFEILKIDFVAEFEDAVVATQVEEQKITVNTFTQKVIGVLKEIDVLSAENEAHIAQISAEAHKTAKENIANATTQAFHLKQDTKANMYTQLKEKLKFSNSDMKQYIKIKSLLAKSQQGKVTLNVTKPKLKAQKKKKQKKSSRAVKKASPKAETPVIHNERVHAGGALYDGSTSKTLPILSNATAGKELIYPEGSHDDQLKEVAINAAIPSHSVGQRLLSGRASGFEL